MTVIWTGQLQQLQDEIGILREQLDVSSGSHEELESARDEAKVLKRALEAATSEHNRDVATAQTNLSSAMKDLDKWRETANKYEREIDNLQYDLQQQGKQWQKTAEIQGTAWCKYLQDAYIEANTVRLNWEGLLISETTKFVSLQFYLSDRNDKNGQVAYDWKSVFFPTIKRICYKLK